MEREKISDGWWHKAKMRVSPNCNARPDTAVDLLVIHNICLPPDRFGEAWVEKFFLNTLPANGHPYFEEIAHLKVSAHCYIDRHGATTQFVPFHLRAWHAGQSVFQGKPACNDYSIGIELEGTDHIDYTSAQYETLAELTDDLCKVYPGITRERIVGHSDIAPGRKTDPGKAFNWTRFHALLRNLA